MTSARNAVAAYLPTSALRTNTLQSLVPFNLIEGHGEIIKQSHRQLQSKWLSSNRVQTPTAKKEMSPHDWLSGIRMKHFDKSCKHHTQLRSKCLTTAGQQGANECISHI